jgi:hypothetical protein
MIFGAFWNQVHPGFDPLGSDPRYHDLRRSTGFPEDRWQTISES